MFRQLQQLLSTPKITNDSKGKIVDLLRNVSYFKDIQHTLGSDYLLSIIDHIEPFILRQGLTLINNTHQYVLVEGKLSAVEQKYKNKSHHVKGHLIDLKQTPSMIYTAENDCYLVSISKNGPFVKKLQQLQRDQRKKYVEFQKIIEQHQSKIDILRRNSFFNGLGHYDCLEMAVGCQLKTYKQGQITHEVGQPVEKIGFIALGKVKLLYTTGLDGKQHSDGHMSWILNEGDWINLQQYLWHRQTSSRGQIASIGTSILWIPIVLFGSKYNSVNNNDAITKLISLTHTKKILFQRSLNTRRAKQQQIQNNSKQREVSQQLQAKIKTLQIPNKKKSISRGYLSSQKKIQLPLPETIVHKVHNLQEELIYLPKITDKTSLFPQEYSAVAISPNHKREMDRLKIAMGTYHLQSHMPKPQRNTSNLFQTIYNQISFRHYEKAIKVRPSMIRQRSVGHYNRSIYNNFKIGIKNEAKKKSLSIDLY